VPGIVKRRALLSVLLVVAAWLTVPAARSLAAGGCAPGGTPPTEVDLNGALATIGESDTVTATSAQDPAVTSAQTISCGDLTIAKDGVQQP
jgi:hypothetical protein